MRVPFIVSAVLGVAAIGPAGAQSPQGPKALREVPGFQCRLVRQTDDTRAGNLPAVRALPSAAAPAVEGGRIGSVAFVQPGGDMDGFAQLLLPDGRTAWLEAAWLEPWRRGVCRVVVLDDGRIGYRVQAAR